MNIDVNVLLEIFGYIGSVLVVSSMLMTSVTKLRIINMCGSVISTIYSIIVGAWPIVVMNTCIFLINLYHVVVSVKDKLDLTYALAKGSDTSVCQFISLYDNVIIAKDAAYTSNITESTDALVLFNDSVIASVFAGKIEAECFVIDFCYALPEFENGAGATVLDFLRSKGISKLCPTSPALTREIHRLGIDQHDGILVEQI